MSNATDNDNEDEDDFELIPDEDIQKGVTIANNIVDHILEEAESEENDFDVMFVIYGLFLNTIPLLHGAGWPVRELIDDIFEHTEE